MNDPFSRVLWAWACMSAVAVGTVCAADAPQEEKIRVLVVTGGHDFQAEPFYAMFDANQDIQYRKVQVPEQADMLGPELADQIDVLVLYDMSRGFTPEQNKRFQALLQKGIGVVALHHTLGSHQQWPEYQKIIGGQYLIEPREVNGQQVPGSTFQHDVDMHVKIADPAHPITQGLKDFDIHDEAYKQYWTDPDVQVLLTTDHALSDPELAWVKTYGNSRVFYLELGHDRYAYENPNYRTLLARGIRWAASRPTDSHARWTPLFDGQTTSGWQQVGGSRWEVRDGVLIGRQGPGNAPGDLLSEKSFDDFELRVDYRMVWPGNSGVWYRYQSADQAYQADILEFENPKALSGTLYCTGKMFLAINVNDKIFDREGWNTLVIRSAGTRQLVFLNGHKVADVYDDTSDHGKIGFQIHAGDQFAPMEIHVRQIEIRPL